MRAGTQYSRMSSPMVVPGPTLVRVSLSCFESIAVLRCCLLSDRVSLLLRVGGVKRGRTNAAKPRMLLWKS